MNRRRPLYVAAAAALALLAWLLLRPAPEPDFDLSVQVGDSTQTTPWSRVHVVALVEARGKRVTRLDGWSIAWRSDGGELDTSGAESTFRSRHPGHFEVTVDVRSPGRHEHSATVAIDVESPPPVVQHPVAVAAAPATQDPAPGRFHIDDLSVDKPVLCRGEQTVVHMKGHHDDPAKQALLHPVIRGQVGWDVPYIGNDRDAGRYPITALLYEQAGESAVQTETIYVELRNCVAPWFMVVNARPAARDGGPDSYDLRATLRPGPEWDAYITAPAGGAGPRGGPTANAASYAWDFGDGETAVTATPTVRHRYPDEDRRPRGELEHSYLATVQARDEQGQALASATTNVLLANAHRDLKARAHTVQLETRSQPVGIADGNGKRYVDVELVNLDDEETVYLDRLDVKSVTCDDQMTTTTVSVTDYFAEPVVTPRGTVRGRFAWPEGAASGPCVVRGELFGLTEPGGLAAQAFFEMQMGKRSNSAIEVKDPDGRFAEISALLGNPESYRVADIARLEREGKIPAGTTERLVPR